jgi:hypothetical protein
MIKIFYTLLFLLVSANVIAQGASSSAPGRQKDSSQSAKQFAPGQEKAPGQSAKPFAPGQQNKSSATPVKKEAKKSKDKQ